MTVKVNVLTYKVLVFTLIKLASMMYINAQAMPTNVINYSSHINAVELA